MFKSWQVHLPEVNSNQVLRLKSREKKKNPQSESQPKEQQKQKHQPAIESHWSFREISKYSPTTARRFPAGLYSQRLNRQTPAV